MYSRFVYTKFIDPKFIDPKFVDPKFVDPRFVDLFSDIGIDSLNGWSSDLVTTRAKTIDYELNSPFIKSRHKPFPQNSIREHITISDSRDLSLHS